MTKQETYFTTIKGRLYVRVPYLDSSGKWRSKYRRVANRAEGRAVAAKLKSETQAPAPVAADKMTFAQLVERYPRPMPKWYKQVCLDHFGAWKLQKIDYAALLAFREKRAKVKHRYTKEVRAAASVNREVEAMRRFLAFAARKRWILYDPFTDGDGLILKSEETARDRIPTDEEINRLLEKAVDERAHLRPLIIAALDTGLRKGKLLSLTLRQIDFERGLLDLGRPASRTKRHPRFVGVTARLKRELQEWLETHPVEPDERVFGIKGDFKHAWRTLCTKAKVHDLHFHDLRHWYATNAILAGLPKDLVMKQTGHSQAKTFDRYFNVDEEIALGVAKVLDGTHK